MPAARCLKAEKAMLWKLLFIGYLNAFIRYPHAVCAKKCLHASSRGRATVLLKKAISGPIKNAVMMVPIPTEPKICPILMPETRQSATPAMTHTLSVIMRQNWKGIRFCRSDQTRATAS